MTIKIKKTQLSETAQLKRNLKQLMDKIEGYRFVCNGGTLETCEDWVRLRNVMEFLAKELTQ